MALTRPELEELEERLLDAQASLMGVAQILQAWSSEVDLEQSEMASLSRLDARQTQNMAVANEQSSHKDLVAISAALDRIYDQSYGSCVACNQPIPIARLKAVPESAYCVNCSS